MEANLQEREDGGDEEMVIFLVELIQGSLRIGNA
jgi:hypothetical protein